MIIDTHTHFYDPSRKQGVPWPPENDRVLYRTVLPEHFVAVAAPLGVDATVVVEASTWLTDNHWILDLAESEPSIVGFVGNVDLTDPDFQAKLGPFTRNRLFRGIRARGNDVGRLLEAPVLAHLRVLADLDLSLDLLAQPAELPAVAELAAEVPGLRIVIDHVGHVPIDGMEPDRAWQQGMRAAAGGENVYCKVSRLTEAAVSRPAPTDPAFYAPTLTALWRAFGSSRLMYGSNWPVCELASDYQTGLAVVQSFLANRPESESDDLMWRTAKAAYKWIERERTGDKT